MLSPVRILHSYRQPIGITRNIWGYACHEKERIKGSGKELKTVISLTIHFLIGEVSPPSRANAPHWQPLPWTIPGQRLWQVSAPHTTLLRVLSIPSLYFHLQSFRAAQLSKLSLAALIFDHGWIPRLCCPTRGYQRYSFHFTNNKTKSCLVPKLTFQSAFNISLLRKQRYSLFTVGLYAASFAIYKGLCSLAGSLVDIGPGYWRPEAARAHQR